MDHWIIHEIMNTESKAFEDNALIEQWQRTRAALMEDYNALTEADLELEPGNEQETMDRIGKRLGKTSTEALSLVRDTANRLRHQAGNSAGSTVGTRTDGTHAGHKDLPEAAERKARRDKPKPDGH